MHRGASISLVGGVLVNPSSLGASQCTHQRADVGLSDKSLIRLDLNLGHVMRAIMSV